MNNENIYLNIKQFIIKNQIKKLFYDYYIEINKIKIIIINYIF